MWNTKGGHGEKFAKDLASPREPTKYQRAYDVRNAARQEQDRFVRSKSPKIKPYLRSADLKLG